MSKLVWILVILIAVIWPFVNHGDALAMPSEIMHADGRGSSFQDVSCMANSGPVMVTGEYTFVPNPCTTEPCLPGLIFALKVNQTYYYLTVAGHWLWDAQSWDGFTPQVGQIVEVSGEINEQIDVAGQSFKNLEVISLKPIL